MAITINIDDLNIPLDIQQNADTSQELSRMITEIKSLSLALIRKTEEDLTETEEYYIETAIVFEVTARFYQKEIPQDNPVSHYGPNGLFVSRDAGFYLSLCYNNIITLI